MTTVVAERTEELFWAERLAPVCAVAPTLTECARRVGITINELQDWLTRPEVWKAVLERQARELVRVRSQLHAAIERNETLTATKALEQSILVYKRAWAPAFIRRERGPVAVRFAGYMIEQYGRNAAP